LSRVASLAPEDSSRGPTAADPQAGEQRGSQTTDQRNAELDDGLENPLGEQTDDPLEDQPDDQLDGYLSISGRVLDEAGEPLAGIELIARATRLFQLDEGTAIPPSLREQRTRTGVDGTYHFGQLPDGEFTIRTTATDEYSTAQITVRAGVDFADLVLPQLALRVHGVILDRGGEPLAGVRVLPAASGAQARRSDAGGRYELVFVLKGTTRGFSIRFEQAGYHAQQVQLDETHWREVKSLALDVAMEPVEVRAEVAGSLVSTAGEPVAGETVRLYSPRRKRSFSAVSDHAGAFSIGGVETADDYHLTVHPKGPYRDYTERNLRVTADGLYLEIALEPLELGGRLSGQMVDLDGNPIPHFTLTLRNNDAVRRSMQVTGDAQGYFVVEGAPEGKLVFETRSMPHLSISGIQLNQGTESNILLVVDWGEYEVSGAVVDSDDNPVSVPDVSLSWTHDEDGVRSYSNRKTAADADGHFQFTGLGPGRHTLHVNVPGFKSARLHHEVGYEGNEVVVRLEEQTP
jgi:hypothetical protein